jgi:MraZ protein
MHENPDHLPQGEPQVSSETDAISRSIREREPQRFSGNASARLDDRGRLKLPAEFRNFIERKYGKGYNEFYITSLDGETAEVYPLVEWWEREKLIFETLPPSDKRRKKLMNAYNYWGTRSDMDPQGRLVILDRLRENADLKTDVQVSAEGTFLRVTSLKKLAAMVLSEPLSDDEIDSLASLGL